MSDISELLRKGKAENDYFTSNLAVVKLELSEWTESQVLIDMEEADRYYNFENDIRNKKRLYLDKDRIERENKTLSNVKIASPIYRKIIKGNLNFAFGKDFIISVEYVGDGEQTETTTKLAEQYERELLKIVDSDFREQVTLTGNYAIRSGIGYSFVDINEDGKLVIYSTPSKTIIPQFKDEETRKKLAHIIRRYPFVIYDGDKKINIFKIEFYDDQIVERFIEGAAGIIPDVDENGNNISFHLTRKKRDGQVVENIGWGKVPFLFMKGQEDEKPLLKSIKGHVDAQDILESKTMDTLIDNTEGIIVIITNGAADIEDQQQLRRDLVENGILVLSNVNDVKILKNEIDIKGYLEKKEDTDKTILKNGNFVDIRDLKSVGNVSGIVLKYLYQDLDTDTNELETQFRIYFRDFKYFFDKYLEMNKIGNVKQWSDYEINVTLNRDMMVNVDEVIKQLDILDGKVSQETLDNWNPAVDDHITEQRRREAEAKEREEKEQEARNQIEMLYQKTQETQEQEELGNNDQ